MKKFFNSLIVLLILFLLISFKGVSQTTLTLQPDAGTGKDARIHSSISQYNSGISDEFLADAWSWSGTNGTYRCLIDFDLSNLPSNAVITSATLYLYAFPAAHSEGHYNAGGSNECYLQRITSSWDESTVTWATQPSVTTQNQAVLAETSDENKNYEIDMAQLISDSKTNPNQSFGFMLRLKTETKYRRMTFASSDHANAALHPKLVIVYTEPIETDSCITLQPNASIGKDARIHSSISQYNSGISDEFLADAWTWSGTNGTYRSLIDFDISSIPQNATITSAKLYLYAFPAAHSEGHYNTGGSNECYLQRITSSWDESTVTWSTQPSVTTQNQAVLAQTNDENKNYEVDMTELYKDVLANPSQSYGFMFRLKSETKYRRMTFASSDNSDSTLHPKLVICFTIPDTLFNISGKVYFGDSLLTDGSVALYNADKDSSENPVSLVNIKGDSFFFKDIPKGEYILKGIPKDFHSKTYYSTYYVKTVSWNKAYKLKLETDISSIDISLVKKTTSSLIEMLNEYKLTIFPNPANDIIQVKFNGDNSKKSKLIITDLLGKVVYSEDLDFSTGILLIKTNTFEPGMYLISIQENNKISQSKRFQIIR